jgi:hypothetical protein
MSVLRNKNSNTICVSASAFLHCEPILNDLSGLKSQKEPPITAKVKQNQQRIVRFCLAFAVIGNCQCDGPEPRQLAFLAELGRFLHR